MNKLSTIFVFKAENAALASGVFSTFDHVQEWVQRNYLTGVVIEYPLDISAYDWAVEKGVFKAKTAIDSAPVFIGSFVSAYQRQWLFRHGEIMEEICE